MTKKEEDDTREIIEQLRQINDYVLFYSNEQQCLDYMRSVENEKIFLILNDQISLTVLEQCEQMNQVDTVFILCCTPENYEHFLKQYCKVFGIYCKRHDLLVNLKENINLLERQLQTFSFFQQHREKAIRELSKESVSFLWFQIFKDLLQRLPRNDHSKQQLVDFCHQYYRENKQELEWINEFKTSYTAQNAIQWYTRETFLYRLLNKALRTEDITQLHTFRFFIVDLSSSLAEEHQKMKERDKTAVIMLYRGLKLEKDEIANLKQNEDGIISANGFFSTTSSKSIALEFAKKSTKRQNVVSVLYEIKCDNYDQNIVFADISQYSNYPDEKEVLFDIGTTFKIQSVNEDIVDSNLWIIKMQAVNEGLRIAKDYIELNRKQEDEISVTIIFGKLLTLMGKYDQSLIYFQNLLLNESENEDKARIYNNIASIYLRKALYDQAIENYERAYDLMISTKPVPRMKDSARPLTNMGNVYRQRHELDKALKIYRLSLKLIEKYRGEEHLQAAIVLSHIGRIYYEKKDFLRSLEYYEKSLNIREKQLPSVHIRIADCLTNIGRVFSDMKKYDYAIDYHKKALEIYEKLLPSEHDNIATCLMNIGVVLHAKQELSNALDYYFLALKIRHKVFGESTGHPQLAETLRRIGLIYEDQLNIILAQTYYENALTMNLRILPNDHPDIAVLKNDMARIERKNIENV
jgi:tetratricopeptide (TPR) repeat protein